MTDGWFSMNRYKLPNLGKEGELWQRAARLSLCVTAAVVKHSHFASSSMSAHSDSPR